MGQAVFTQTANGLDYAETGLFTLQNGAQMQATRRYKWAQDGAGISVTFDVDTPFHRFDPSGIQQGTSHLCGDDLYNVTYDFTHWPAWSAIWDVTGPRKAYTSVTHYRR